MLLSLLTCALTCASFVLSFAIVSSKRSQDLKTVLLFFFFLATQMTIHTLIALAFGYLLSLNKLNVYSWQLQVLYQFLFMLDTLVYTCELAIILKPDRRVRLSMAPMIIHVLFCCIYIATYMQIFNQIAHDVIELWLCIFLSSVYLVSITIVYGKDNTRTSPSKFLACSQAAYDELTHLNVSNTHVYSV